MSRIGHVTLLQCLFFGPVQKIFFYFKLLKLKKKYSTHSPHKKYKKLIVILLTTPVSYWKVLLYSERKITESYAKTVHVVIYFFFFVIFSSTMPLTRKRKSNKRLRTKVAKASSREDDDVQEDSIHQETYRSEQSAVSIALRRSILYSILFCRKLDTKK